MSKRQALRALKRQKLAAREGYQMHLLDLWFSAECGDAIDLPGNGTGYHRRLLKRRTLVRATTIRP